GSLKPKNRIASRKRTNPRGPGRFDRVPDRRGSVRLAPVHSSQSGGQLYRLLSQRAQLRRGATLRCDRSARQQALKGVVGRSGVAAVEVAARLARPQEVFIETASRGQKENRRRSGSATGH